MLGLSLLCRLPYARIQVGLPIGIGLLAASFRGLLLLQIPDSLADGIADEFRSSPAARGRHLLESFPEFIINFN